MKAFNRDSLKSAIRGSIKRVYKAQTKNLDLYRNTLDCFSASIDSLVQEISLDDWIVQEKDRQIQKTKQNAIGSLHEEVMGSIDGIVNLEVGKLIDIESERLKIVAEVKNKHNTTKGNHKVVVYRDIEKALADRPGFTGYYVEVLPKGGKTYDKPFTPSDNKTKTKLPSREDIRVIDGKSFYALLTGEESAIEELYSELPSIVSEIISEDFSKNLNPDKVVNSASFKYNYIKAYGKT